MKMKSKNSLNCLISFAFMFILILGCGVTADSKIPKEYFGEWVGQDKSKLTIFYNNTAVYEPPPKLGDFLDDGEGPGVNPNIISGQINYDNGKNTFKILGAKDVSFVIEQTPNNNRMKLNGVIYQLQPPVDFNKTKDSPPKTENNQNVPSEHEASEIIGNTVYYYSEALSNEDFTEFLENSAPAFQKQNTNESLKKQSANLIADKNNLLPILQSAGEIKPVFDQEPTMVKSPFKFSLLRLKGYYPTMPKKIYFDDLYMEKDGEWLLWSYKIEIK